MTDHEDSTYFLHILECIEEVRQFTHNKLDVFHEDALTRHATLRVLQIMAESATRISEASKQKMTGITSWRDIRGFRNLLAHDYLGDTNYEIIRKVIELELPKLEKEIHRMIDQQKE